MKIIATHNLNFIPNPIPIPSPQTLVNAPRSGSPGGKGPAIVSGAAEFERDPGWAEHHRLPRSEAKGTQAPGSPFFSLGFFGEAKKSKSPAAATERHQNSSRNPLSESTQGFDTLAYPVLRYRRVSPILRYLRTNWNEASTGSARTVGEVKASIHQPKRIRPDSMQGATNSVAVRAHSTWATSQKHPQPQS